MGGNTLFEKRQDGVVKTFVQTLIHGLDRIMGHYSLVGDRPVFDTRMFPWAQTLEDNWQVMREELDAIMEHREALPNFHNITSDVRTITRDDKWKTYFFYGYGKKAEKNCARCPETTRLIEQVPGMTTAFFSILSPGKHIPAHRGPYKGVLRYHLGLKVPEPAERCRIRVGDRIVHWEEGEGMVFDDTYDHEVWNDTDGERAILFLDVKRPLPGLLDLLNTLVIRGIALSPVIKEAQKNQEQWERRFDDAVHA